MQGIIARGAVGRQVLAGNLPGHAGVNVGQAMLLQHEVGFEDLPCQDLYYCSSTSELLTITLCGGAMLLPLLPSFLRVVLPLFGEPKELASQVGVPADRVRAFVVTWASFTALGLSWVVGRALENHGHAASQILARVGTLFSFFLWMAGLSACVILALQLGTRGARRLLRKSVGIPDRPAWYLVHAGGLAAIVLVALYASLGLVFAVADILWPPAT